MYKVCYYSNLASSQMHIKTFGDFYEAVEFCHKLKTGCFLELKYYENSTDNGSTLRS